MSSKRRNSLLRRVKKNPDYRAITRWCDERGLEYQLHPAMGLGHPYLSITDGKTTIRKTITTSPSPCGHTNSAIKAVTKKWEGAQ